MHLINLRVKSFLKLLILGLAVFFAAFKLEINIPPFFTTKVSYPQCNLVFSVPMNDIITFVKDVQDFAIANSLIPGYNKSDLPFKDGRFMLDLTFTSTDKIEIALLNPFHQEEILVFIYNNGNSIRLPHIYQSFIDSLRGKYSFVVRRLESKCLST